MSEQEIVQAIAERVAQAVAAANRGIVADRVYPPDEAADLIGFRATRRVRAIQAIDRSLLPVVAISANGKIAGYLGRDLLAYIERRRKTA